MEKLETLLNRFESLVNRLENASTHGGDSSSSTPSGNAG